MKYADEIVLVSRLRQDLDTRVNTWKEVLEIGGLKLKVAKTEYMASCTTDLTENEAVNRTVEVKYLASVQHESGNIGPDVDFRISAAWAKGLNADGPNAHTSSQPSSVTS